MSSKVFTYYAPVPGLWSEDSQMALIDIWRRSWKKAGWTPVVLTENDARQHPRFDFFKEHFWALPTEYGHDYCGACFLRWLAVAQFGGGMLTDYDVINYGWEPREVNPAEMQIFCDSPPESIFMGAVLGCAQHFLDMSELFAAWRPDEHDFNRTAGMHHCDDLSMLVRMFQSGVTPKPPWLVKKPGCALFDYLSWRTSKLVHYGYAMRGAGYWPKHEWIEKLRPF